jgi:hypothetical protein
MSTPTPNSEQATLYRIEVEGRLSRRAGLRIGDRVASAGPNTVLDLEVADQSALLGRLRRIHDLNLRLVRVTRIDTMTNR